jgi:hypothetical protein
MLVSRTDFSLWGCLPLARIARISQVLMEPHRLKSVLLENASPRKRFLL